MVLLFPGQGSQQPGMGQFLFDNFKLAQQVFEEASDSINLDLKKLCFTGSVQDLALTENTQPALLTVSTATQRVLRAEAALKIEAAAGHSIGEYAALVAANGMSFSDAVRAVRIRGQAMQSAVPVGQGGMVAVMGLDPDQVDKLCQWANQNFSSGRIGPANYNSPGQIVISGSQKTLESLRQDFNAEKVFGTALKVKFIPLQVSAPFHCEMMKPAEEKMREVLENLKFQAADFPILQNLTAQFHDEPATLRENLIRQVSAPVKWMQSMNLLLDKGLVSCVECGAGSVLKGLLKKIDSERFQVFNTQNLEELQNLLKTLKN